MFSMKSRNLRTWLRPAAVWVLPILLAAGCGKQTAELAAQKEKEIESLRAELEKAKAGNAAAETELARLRKDNQELLSLRNKVRQLGEDKKQLSQQAQSAQAQVEQAQAQTQAAQSQVQQAVQALTAQQQAAAAARAAARQTSAEALANACINSLRILDGAKQQWALEKRKTAADVPAVADVAAYLKDGAMLVCPAGGAYTLGAVGANPVCTVQGHALPQ